MRYRHMIFQTSNIAHKRYTKDQHKQYTQTLSQYTDRIKSSLPDAIQKI